MQSCAVFLFSEYSSCHLQSAIPVRLYRLTHNHLLPASSVSTLPAKVELILSPLEPRWGVSFLLYTPVESKEFTWVRLATTVKTNVLFDLALQTIAWNGRCWSSSLWCSAINPTIYAWFRMNNQQNLLRASHQSDCECAVGEAQRGLQEAAVPISCPSAAHRCDPSCNLKSCNSRSSESVQPWLLGRGATLWVTGSCYIGLFC